MCKLLRTKLHKSQHWMCHWFSQTQTMKQVTSSSSSYWYAQEMSLILQNPSFLPYAYVIPDGNVGLPSHLDENCNKFCFLDNDMKLFCYCYTRIFHRPVVINTVCMKIRFGGPVIHSSALHTLMSCRRHGYQYQPVSWRFDSVVCIVWHTTQCGWRSTFWWWALLNFIVN